ncbi:MAG: SpoVA/SpoVAEb family sporulation membrane protein [Firmicutes bacterium]|nr:SpoVA/SpoVAEb family sporulation membrane protein [Bacillota bacterium]MCL2256104.1 SpoVA/SpoVAEb family sporulation membrane protein [Bacillota bacterium]
MIQNKLLLYLVVFAVGGTLCAIAQLLVVKTKKITPTRIVVGFLLLGILLEGVGVFQPMREFARSGVTIPIMGFGAALARGAIDTAREVGFHGAFAGGLMKTSYGIGVAVILSMVVSIFFFSKSK